MYKALTLNTSLRSFSNRMFFSKLLLANLVLVLATATVAKDKIELETTTIKGNKELPKILYLVPWKELTSTRNQQQNLVLHSLFGELFDPLTPEAFIVEQKLLGAQ